jgi:hypothetical protein
LNRNVIRQDLNESFTQLKLILFIIDKFPVFVTGYTIIGAEPHNAIMVDSYAKYIVAVQSIIYCK